MDQSRIDCVITLDTEQRWLLLDFSQLRLKSLLVITQLHLPGVQECDSWAGAAYHLREAMRVYFAEDRRIMAVEIGPSFTIIVKMRPRTQWRKLKASISDYLELSTGLITS